MYKEYKVLLAKEALLSSQLAKQKLLGSGSEDVSHARAKILSDIQTVSDRMTFANPIVWMMYKFEAYKNENQPIKTLHDFRVHCSKPGHICTKRFTFVNAQLESKGKNTLLDRTYFPDELSLDSLFENGELLEVFESDTFLKLWNQYEFNKDGKRVAKWENFF